ncbi:MAG: adenylate/guanylate cyclase domain-containing protein [Deltaproteobacteria bacterium]|nr:adenylate/guanylate cyclase domain-containing protein [Candidatus Zymogenaceae bacterium]
MAHTPKTPIVTPKKKVAGQKKTPGLSLTYKIALLASILVTISMVLATAITVRREINQKKDDADLRMANTAAMIKLAMDSMPVKALDGWVRSLYTVRFDTKEYNLDLVYVIIADDEGRFIVSTGNPRVHIEGEGGDVTAPQELLDRDVHGLRKVEVEITDKETGTVTSTIYLGYYLLNLYKSILLNTVLKAVLITLVLIAAAVACSYLLAKRLTDPIHDLVLGMESVADGDFSRKVAVITGDEIGFLADTFNGMADGLKEREFIKDTFKRYVTREVAEKILSQKDDIILTGEKREVTVLFSDIRGFARMAEETPPVELVSTLNDYFSVMIDIIFKYEGVLDKFIGDAVMAFWNAPLDQKNPALRAVLAAYEMQRALVAVNRRRKAENKPPINMGVGINTGEAVAGTVGSEKKMEYTVIGDTVNVAQRLESVTLPGQILISESTYRKTGGRITARELPPQALKGILRQVRIFDVIDIKPTGGDS